MAAHEHLGRYEILGTIGHGGFATVYRALDPTLGRQVALKALLPHLAADPELRRRFLTEARAIAKLRHANIVAFYDIGEAAGRPYYTMELIDGPTIAQALESGERLPLERATEITRSLCSALDYLHNAGLVHRDIKASNVMLDPTGRAVLMDFGIVRMLDQTQQTRTGTSLGTPGYMAPEQVMGEPAGTAADVYALGVLAYHMLAGRLPFLGETAHVLHAHVYLAPPALRGQRPDLPEHVCAAVESALAKDPAQRPSSAGRFAELFEGAAPLPGELAPSPEQETRRSGKARRRVIMAILGAAGVLVVVAVAAPLIILTRGGDKPPAGQRAPGIAAAPSRTGALGAPPSSPPPTAGPAPIIRPGQTIPLSIVDTTNLPACPGQDGLPRLKSTLTITSLQATTTNSVVVQYKFSVPEVPGVRCGISWKPDLSGCSGLLVTARPGEPQHTKLWQSGDGFTTTPYDDIYGKTIEGAWQFDAVDLNATSIGLVQSVPAAPPAVLTPIHLVALLPRAGAGPDLESAASTALSVSDCRPAPASQGVGR